MMKKILLILLLLIPVVGFSQKTKIRRDQIHDDAFRARSIGVLTDPALVFDEPWKKFTKTVDSDITLSINVGSSVAESRIDILATGDGVHTLSFPTNWKMRGDAYDPTAVQRIQLVYDGISVVGEIINLRQTAVDAIATQLNTAIVTNAVPTELNLSFNEAVLVLNGGGWTVVASGSGLVVGAVSGSGTTNIVFSLSRAILAGETVTVSYSGGIDGTTTDLAGFPLTTITDFPVTVPSSQPSPVETFDIYVDDDAADDVAAGTIGDPYKTISAAENAATNGQKIGIRAGTYRETVVVDHNSITFKAYPGETAIINGFTVIPNTGWTVHSGNIYKKTITLPIDGYVTSTGPSTVTNTFLFANQILRNGSMMFEARFPNIDSFDDLMTWESYKQYSWTQGFKATQLNDINIPGAAGTMTGATIVSNGWYDTFARTVTGHDNSGPGGTERLTYASIRDDSDPGQWMRQAYYLVDDLDLLDAEQEWFYTGGTLYFWQPGGGTISGTVEHKARNWGFDVRGRTGTVVDGLTFIGVDPVMSDAASTNTTIQNTAATFNNHAVRHDYFLWNGVQVGIAKQLGTKLLGANSVFKNNVWSKAALAMLWMGPNCIVENNHLYENGYAGNPGGTLITWEQDGGQKILRNTIHDTGRGAIYFGYVERGHHDNMEIGYNHFYNYGKINGDGGATYAGDQTILAGLNMHHNWMHTNLNRSTPGFGGLNGGIYFDQGSGGGGGATVHHNVVWDNMTGDIYHLPIYNGFTNAPFNIYNNTFATDLSQSYGGVAHSYKTPSTSPLDVQRNNIYVRRILVNWEDGNVGNNANYIYQYGNGTNPLFVGSGGDGLNYRIQTGSPAKNAGQVIPGITDGSVGVPDIGAYEFGGEDWVPGYVAPANDGTVNDDAFTYSLDWTEKNNSPQTLLNGDIHYTTTTTRTATFAFNTTKAKIYMEGCDNHGIARLEILNNLSQVIATHDLDTYVDTGGTTTCGTPVQLEYEFTGLAAGVKTARITFQTADLGQTPQRNSIAVDGGRFYD